jgi:iron(III) transport system permease protein
MDVANTIKNPKPTLRRLYRVISTPRAVLTALLFILLIGLIVIPLGRMLWTSFTWQMGDQRLSRDAKIGEFTIFHWKRMFASSITKSSVLLPMRNSLVTASLGTIIALGVGSILAWLVTRTDLPLRKFISSVATIPFMLPSWVLAIAWMTFFQNKRFGGAPGLLGVITGVEIPNWAVYGPVPISIALALHYYSFSFLFLSGAMNSIDPSLEEAAETLGASRWRMFRKIILPLMMPAFLSAFILTFSRSLSTFGTAFFLGRPVRYYTLATMLFSSIKQGLVADGLILAILLIAISGGVMYINQCIIGTRKSFQTITGKRTHSRRMPLGKWKLPVLILVLLFLFLAVFLPLGVIMYNSFMLIDGDYSFSNFSLHYWIGKPDNQYGYGYPGLLIDPTVHRATWNSIRLAIGTAIISSVFGILLGYTIVRGRGTRFSKLLEQISFLPYLMPGIALGGIYLTMFAKPFGPIPSLYGTFFLIVLASSIKRLPFTSRAGVSAMMQLGDELEEAAIVAGATWGRRFRKIILPLTSKGLLAGALLSFIASMRALALIVLLVTPSTETLTTTAFRYVEENLQQFRTAMATLMVVLVFVGTMIINYITKNIGKMDEGAS